jgi:hypothetical protein
MGQKLQQTAQLDRLKIQGQRLALVLPRSHVATRYGVDYVALVRADGSAGEIPVQTAPGPSATEVEILSGLKAGDVVAPAGAPR